MKTKISFLILAALVLGTAGSAVAAKGKPTQPHAPAKKTQAANGTARPSPPG